MLRFTIILFCLLLISCTKAPTKEEVCLDFLRENPGTLVVSVYPGEGDGDTVYYYIKFKVPDDQRLYQVEWQYLFKNGKMTLNHKEPVKEVKQ